MHLLPRFHFKWRFSEPALVHPPFVSVTALQSCWAAAVEAGEVSTAQRGKQLLPSENPAPAPQASLATAQEGFVLPQCLTWEFNVPREPGLLLRHERPCHRGSVPGQLCMGKQYSHPQVPVELLFTGEWLPWPKLEAPDEEFPREMGFSWHGCEDNDFFFISGEAALAKLKWH